jgi:hypothetical protein
MHYGSGFAKIKSCGSCFSSYKTLDQAKKFYVRPDSSLDITVKLKELVVCYLSVQHNIDPPVGGLALHLGAELELELEELVGGRGHDDRQQGVSVRHNVLQNNTCNNKGLGAVFHTTASTDMKIIALISAMDRQPEIEF